jgi:glucokinase
MFVGIEIGGTKLQLGVGPGDGVLAGLWRGTVDPAAGADGIRRQITVAMPELLTKAAVNRRDLRGVGIGFGGPVDDRTQTVIKSHQIAGWDDFPLADWVGEMLGLPAALGNDADVAGLAEALFGAGKGLSPIFYITIGSGIGGGLIINGEIYRGCGRGAAEIGHLRVIPPSAYRDGLAAKWGELYPSGPIQSYPLEAVASGWAIQRNAQKECTDGDTGLREELLPFVDGNIDLITAAHVAQAIRNGGTQAQAVLDRALTCLAFAISQVITLCCPRRIVIGGGVSLMGEELFYAPLREYVATQVFRPFADLYDIVPAALGEEMVVHGALALARQRFGS